jgi:hypothetical protein
MMAMASGMQAQKMDDKERQLRERDERLRRQEGRMDTAYDRALDYTTRNNVQPPQPQQPQQPQYVVAQPVTVQPTAAQPVAQKSVVGKACPECGEPVEADAAFCENCGSPVN